MKYYSETLNKTFDTVEELEEAEAKELNKEATLEALTKKRDEAKDALESAKNRAEELEEEYRKKIEDVLTPAVEALDKAEEELREFKNTNYTRKTYRFTGSDLGSVLDHVLDTWFGELK